MSLTLNEYIERDNQRKLCVKKYFAKRNTRIDFEHKYFIDNANNETKKSLQTLLNTIKS